jgi:uncharacterized protein
LVNHMDSVRTCLVCRKKASKPELCRFVRALDGEICFDERGDLPHRGAWLCAERACFVKACQKKMLFKGEKTLPITAEAMTDMVFTRLKKSSLARLGFLRKLGHIEAGREAVKRLMVEDKATAVLLAKDLSKRSHEEIFLKGKNAQAVPYVSPYSMDEIGQSIGRKKTGVVGLLKSRITDEILLQLKKLSNLKPL